MKTALAWIKAFAAAIGGPGLFIIAFLDSSFLSFPQVTDLLVVSMVVRIMYWMSDYAAMATPGSVAGCLAIYYVARKGGDALVRRRFKGGMLDRAHRLVERYGVMTLLIPAILPPPSPFKISSPRRRLAHERRAVRHRHCRRPGDPLPRHRAVDRVVRPARDHVPREERAHRPSRSPGPSWCSAPDTCSGAVFAPPRRFDADSGRRYHAVTADLTMSPELSVVIPIRNEEPNSRSFIASSRKR